MTDWSPSETAPRDGSRILARNGDGEPFITAWVDDVWTVQGGSGGPSGWFSGRYRDHWGDNPILDVFTLWTALPR
jgi:hypothetical protein